MTCCCVNCNLYLISGKEQMEIKGEIKEQGEGRKGYCGL
jgi:hypothetical protein